jgi:SAM-dependent methyltransferase
MSVLDNSSIYAYYGLGREHDRLSIDPRGVLEFERTTEIVLRRLPAAPAVVADIGGGPGRYTLWLADNGYEVEHRDLMPLHIQQLNASRGAHQAIRARVADARALDLADESVDAVLLLGPVYHLPQVRADPCAARGMARGQAGRSRLRRGHLPVGAAARRRTALADV